MKIGYMGNEVSMKNIYENGRYFDKNPTWHTEDSPWKAKQILYCLNRNHIRPDSVCEVGCGAGEILNQLHRQMAGDVLFHGYEISPQAYQLCKGRAKERLEFFSKISWKLIAESTTLSLSSMFLNISKIIFLS